MRVPASVALILAPTALFAWSDVDRITTAQALGNVLGSESVCELSFNQDAIAAYIDATIPADDMKFTPMLITMTTASERQASEMSRSALTAHCRQIARVAASFGFVSG